MATLHQLEKSIISQNYDDVRRIGTATPYLFTESLRCERGLEYHQRIQSYVRGWEYPHQDTVAAVHLAPLFTKTQCNVPLIYLAIPAGVSMLELLFRINPAAMTAMLMLPGDANVLEQDYPLFYAVYIRDPAVVRFLLDRVEDGQQTGVLPPDLIDRMGREQTHIVKYAAKWPNLEIMRMVVDGSKMDHLRGRDGRNVLHTLIENYPSGKTAEQFLLCIQFLISRCPDLMEQKCRAGLTPLRNAPYNYFVSILRMFMQAGFKSLTAPDEGNETLLHDATACYEDSSGHTIETVQYLIRWGGSMMECGSDDDCTPFDYSIEDTKAERAKSRILAACSGCARQVAQMELTEDEIAAYRFDVYFSPSLIHWLLYL